MGNIISPRSRSRLPFKTAVPTTATAPIGPASSVVSETSFAQSAAVGTSLRFARQDHTHGTPAVGTGGIFRWACATDIIAPVNNPSDSACVYWQRIWLPWAQTLTKYQYGMRGAGVATDGAMWLSLWTDVTGTPTIEYEDSRAMAIPGGESEGCITLYPGYGYEEYGTHNTIALPAGWTWLATCVQTNSVMGVTKPNIDYFDGGEVGKGYAGYKIVTGHGGWPEAADIFDTTCQKVPGIWLVMS